MRRMSNEIVYKNFLFNGCGLFIAQPFVPIKIEAQWGFTLHHRHPRTTTKIVAQSNATAHLPSVAIDADHFGYQKI